MRARRRVDCSSSSTQRGSLRWPHDVATASQPRVAEKIQRLQGPILVLGASGFVGANLLPRAPRASAATSTAPPPASPPGGSRTCPTTTSGWSICSSTPTSTRSSTRSGPARSSTASPTAPIRSRPTASSSTRPTSTSSPACCRGWKSRSIACYVHAGSSSEYGDNAAGPGRARSHGPQQRLRRLQGRRGQPDLLSTASASSFPAPTCGSIRSYGPLEDSSRLIPNRDPPRPGRRRTPSSSTRPSRATSSTSTTSTEAFVDTALNLTPTDYGESFNIGTGRKTTIGEVAATARELFGIAAEPSFTHARASLGRHRLVRQHRQGPGSASAGSRAPASSDGLQQTDRLVSTACPTRRATSESSKKFGLDTVYSVSADHRLLQGQPGDSRSCTSGSRRRSPS